MASLYARGSGSDALHTNPFKMPTDEEVFILRDEERKPKAANRERIKFASVKDKATMSSRCAGYYGDGDGGKERRARNEFNVHERLGPKSSSGTRLFGGGPGGSSNTSAGEKNAAARLGLPELVLPVVTQRVKDNMSKYIAKKRKLGLDRMALATKRQEIKKLDDEAERAEKRITQMEEQLKETKGKFRAFLQHSEMEQVEAFKRAEHETKEKQDKQQIIKKLSAQIAQIEADKKKNEEHLAQCLEFKTFLDQLTDPKWVVITLGNLRKDDARQQILDELDKKFSELLAEQQYQLLLQQQQQQQLETNGQPANSTAPVIDAAMVEEQLTQQMQAELDARCAEVGAQIDEEVAPMDDETRWSHLNNMDPERVPMYFTNPNQILKKFMEIEEGNLFLIETCQSYEEEIEKIRAEYAREQRAKQMLAESKKQQKEDIMRKITLEVQKMEQLQERIENANRASVKEMTADGQESYTQNDIKLLIEKKVKAIYSRLGNEDMGEIGTLGMLTAIEVQLDRYRQEIKNLGIDDAFCRDVMKSKDKARRGEQRAIQVQKQKAERLKRSQLALDRSKAPVKKRVGKPVVWRSRPLDHRKQEQEVQEEENEDEEFFA